MQSETYEKFLKTLDESEFKVWQQNALINQAVQLGLRSDLTEVETLKVIIMSMLKIYNDDVTEKLDEMMRNPVPTLLKGRFKL